MGETIHIGSVPGNLFTAALFLAIAAALGYAIYALLARPETRRAEFLARGAVSRRTALAVAIPFSLLLYLLICWSLFSGFQRIDVEGEWLHLRYYLPPRTETIRRDQLSLLEKRFAHKVSWRLAISTADGRSFESSTAGAAAIEAARLRLAQLAAE